MRTEEETKYNLDEKIFDLYDNGLSVENIASQVGATSEYVQALLAAVTMESA